MDDRVVRRRRGDGRGGRSVDVAAHGARRDSEVFSQLRARAARPALQEIEQAQEAGLELSAWPSYSASSPSVEDRGAPVTDVVLFHHAQGLTDGVREFAGRLRAWGHHVTAPDLYEAKTVDSFADGAAYAEQVGFDTIIERGRLAAEGLPQEIVYAGFSLGVMPAQMLAQTRPGAKGALLFHACVPPSEFGCPWPEGISVQVHGMDADELFVAEGDLDAARNLVEAVGGAELFLYPGDQHLFADSSLPAYDEAAAALLTQRSLTFLDRLTRLPPR